MYIYIHLHMSMCMFVFSWCLSRGHKGASAPSTLLSSNFKKSLKKTSQNCRPELQGMPFNALTKSNMGEYTP